MTQLSLGCGKNPIPGFIGLDNVDFRWNKIWDAREPIPYEDGSIDFIQAHNFFEHLHTDPVGIGVLNECWRVLRKGGILEIVVPNVRKSIDLACADPTHKSFWVMGTFKYLTGERPKNADYGIKPWIIAELRDYTEREERDILAKLIPRK